MLSYLQTPTMILRFFQLPKLKLVMILSIGQKDQRFSKMFMVRRRPAWLKSNWENSKIMTNRLRRRVLSTFFIKKPPSTKLWKNCRALMKEIMAKSNIYLHARDKLSMSRKVWLSSNRWAPKPKLPLELLILHQSLEKTQIKTRIRRSNGKTNWEAKAWKRCHNPIPQRSSSTMKWSKVAKLNIILQRKLAKLPNIVMLLLTSLIVTSHQLSTNSQVITLAISQNHNPKLLCHKSIKNGASTWIK